MKCTMPIKIGSEVNLSCSDSPLLLLNDCSHPITIENKSPLILSQFKLFLNPVFQKTSQSCTINGMNDG